MREDVFVYGALDGRARWLRALRDDRLAGRPRANETVGRRLLPFTQHLYDLGRRCDFIGRERGPFFCSGMPLQVAPQHGPRPCVAQGIWLTSSGVAVTSRTYTSLI